MTHSFKTGDRAYFVAPKLDQQVPLVYEIRPVLVISYSDDQPNALYVQRPWGNTFLQFNVRIDRVFATRQQAARCQMALTLAGGYHSA